VHAGVDTDFDTFDGTDRLSRPNLGYHRLSAIRAPSALKFQRFAAASTLAHVLLLAFQGNSMLKISITDTRAQRRLLVEGRLVAPWVAELRTTWERVRSEGDGRQVVIDIGSVTLISQEGENTLLQLLNDGATFRCCSGVLTKHVLQQLARRCQKPPSELIDETGPGLRKPRGPK